MAKAKKRSAEMSTTMLLWSILGIAILTFCFVALGYFNNSKQTTDFRTQAAPPVKGKPAEVGHSYLLNIIGVAKGKTPSLAGNQGRRLFVPLEGSCNIDLSTGDFQVLDANCTDGPASFQSPNPSETNSEVSSYSVWAKSMGKPTKSSTANTCITQADTENPNGPEATYCSVFTLTLSKQKGQNSFGDVSQYLLYVYTDLNGDSINERYHIFDAALEGYFWKYDNTGQKIVQLRFYPLAYTPSPVPSPVQPTPTPTTAPTESPTESPVPTPTPEIES